MVPVPGAGTNRRGEGVSTGRAVSGVVDVVITAKPDQRLESLPEGASDLGVIFTRADEPADAVRALRHAHDQLHVVIDPLIPLV